MALVSCVECNNQVSERAVSCPHCGEPEFLSEKSCPDCDHLVPKGTNLCSECGHPEVWSDAYSEPSGAPAEVERDGLLSAYLSENNKPLNQSRENNKPVTHARVKTKPTGHVPTQASVAPIIHQHNYPKNEKSMAVGLLLTFFFGPLGLLYTNIKAGLILTVVVVLLAIPTLTVSLWLGWVGSMVWAAIDIDKLNKGEAPILKDFD